MNIFKMALFCFFCLSALVTNAAYPKNYLNSLEDSKMDRDKIYIQPGQVHVSQEGIFIFENEELIRIEQLNCDENGIYFFVTELDKITDKCPNGHKIWCGRCGSCVTRWCKFRCKCVEWE